MRNISFGTDDVILWSELFKDHCQFLQGLCLSDDVKHVAKELEGAWKQYDGRNISVFESLIQGMFRLYDKAKGYPSTISLGDYGALLHHMTEETQYALDSLHGDLSDRDIVDFWTNNFIEHFILLSHTFPVDTRAKRNIVDQFAKIARTLREGDYSLYLNDTVYLHQVLERARDFAIGLDLLSYKMAQHELKESKYGLQQLKKILT